MMKTIVILLVALTGLSHQVPVEDVVTATKVEEVTKVNVVEVTEVVDVTTTVQPEVEVTPFGDCPPEDTDFPTYLSDTKNCSVFYQCAHGVPFRMECRLPLEFNPVLNVCDYPYRAGCLLKNVVQEVEEAHENAAVEAAHENAAEQAVEANREKPQPVEVVTEQKNLVDGVLGTVNDKVLDPVLDTVNGGLLGPVVGSVSDNVLDPVVGSVSDKVLEPVLDTVNENVLPALQARK